MGLAWLVSSVLVLAAPRSKGMQLTNQNRTMLAYATMVPLCLAAEAKRLTEMRVGPAEIRRESYAGRTMSLSLLHELGAIV